MHNLTVQRKKARAFAENLMGHARNAERGGKTIRFSCFPAKLPA
jgi:hypothetical protein